MRKMKKMTAGLLAVAMSVTLLAPVEADAAKKPSLSKKKLTLTLSGKKTATLKVKKASKAKITWKSSKKKVATVKKSGKYAAKVTAKKAGKATITCTVKKNGKKTKLTCKVTVKKGQEVVPSQSPEVSAIPSATPVVSAIPAITVAPTATPTVAPTPEVRNPQSILEAYQDIFPYLGNCVNYHNGQLNDEATLAHVKKHYNSITLENEMKPDTILGGKVATISKEEAVELGYVIPESYKEDTVPKLNFASSDAALQVAYDNGLKMRGHTLQWHSQTPQWFFTENYDGSTIVSEEVMDARIEFYVATVLDHFFKKEIEIAGEAGSIIYAWDITNEYLHRRFAGYGTKTWTSVYGDLGLEPTYVKKAYEVAYRQLEVYNVVDKVTLFYNDFDTYFEADNVVELVAYINEGATDKDGNPVKICGGIGMQSHVDVDRPTIDEYAEALDMFLATGLEVQITELDMTINWDHTSSYTYEDEEQTAEDQAAFARDFMNMVVLKQKNRDKNISPKGITGLTIWGLSDSVSWRGAFQNGGNSEPTLFGDSIDDPKPSYTEFIKASDLWYN